MAATMKQVSAEERVKAAHPKAGVSGEYQAVYDKYAAWVWEDFEAITGLLGVGYGPTREEAELVAWVRSASSLPPKVAADE